MNPLAVSKAFFQAINLSLTKKEIRRLLIRPWLVGLAAYFLGLGCAIVEYGRAAAYASLKTKAYLHLAESGFFADFIGLLTWASVLIALFLATILFAFVVTLLATCFVEDALVERTSQACGITLPSSGPRLRDKATATSKALVRTSVVIVLLLPLMILSFLLSVIPLTMPLGVFLTAWLIAIQAFGPAWEVQQVSVSTRVGNAFRKLFSLATLGLLLLAFAAIPIFGLLSTPLGVVAATIALGSKQGNEQEPQLS